jgi:hypothetical protein
MKSPLRVYHPPKYSHVIPRVVGDRIANLLLPGLVKLS